MTRAMRALADGDKTVEIPGAGRGDEIGGMANAVQVFKETMTRADRLAEEQQAERAAKEQRSARVESLVHTFEVNVGALIDLLSSASAELERYSEVDVVDGQRDWPGGDHCRNRGLAGECRRPDGRRDRRTIDGVYQ